MAVNEFTFCISPNLVRGALAALGSLGIWLFGAWDTLFQALIAIIIIDYVSGILAAYSEQSLNSTIGYLGICKKICIFLMVALANILDSTGGLGEPWIRTMVIMFFIANESLSALENAGRIGVPLPEPLMAALEKIHKPHTSEKGGKGGKP
jgi:toxin secretion/phage lysis holin